MSEWVEIKTRLLTEEEIEYYTEQGVDTSLGIIYDCPLPDDGQEVLVTANNGYVYIDTFCNDYNGRYFENFCDVGDAIAWMPMPEPFKRGDEQ